MPGHRLQTVPTNPSLQVKMTPMHVAVYKGHVDVIMAIIESGALAVTNTNQVGANEGGGGEAGATG